MRRVQWLAGACLLLVASGCQKIADIQERRYDPDLRERDAGADGSIEDDAARPDEAQCDTYCQTLTESCTKENSLATYPSKDFCLAVCPNFRRSKDGTDKGNTFECRVSEANEAKRLSADPDESTSNCRAAGPGGSNKCGSNCEGYCQLFEDICGGLVTPDPDCLEHCQGLRDDPQFDADKSYMGGVDTLQCRLAHLSAAAVDGDTHCPHAQIEPEFGTPCKPNVPSCDDYCGMLMSTCKTPDVLQYESVNDCMKTCKGFEPSEAPDVDQDTLACRRYHTYNSLRNPPGHCTHTGPGGDGHCGKLCPAYCKLVKAACETEFAAAFVGGVTDCESACGQDFFDGKAVKDQMDIGYNVAMGKAGGDTLQCRLYYTTKAFSNVAHCASALGRPTGECQ